MTDRVKALVVVLDDDYREDDIKGLVDAIGHLRGVISVGVSIAEIQDFAARELVRCEFTKKLYQLLRE